LTARLFADDGMFAFPRSAGDATLTFPGCSSDDDALALLCSAHGGMSAFPRFAHGALPFPCFAGDGTLTFPPCSDGALPFPRFAGDGVSDFPRSADDVCSPSGDFGDGG